MAALDAVLVAERPDLEQALAHLHAAADHPIERAAIEQLSTRVGIMRVVW